MKIVRCISASAYPLVVNKEYEVESESVHPATGQAVYRLKGVNKTFFQNRFEVIYNSTTPTSFSFSDVKKVDGHSIAIDYVINDPEEARCRAALKPKIQSHECPCGIARVQCEYHR